MKPTDKSEAVDAFIKHVFGVDRRAVISSRHCVPKPIGCGRVVTPDSFRDECSKREYDISGLCQTCQDLVWPADGSQDSVPPTAYTEAGRMVDDSVPPAPDADGTVL